MIEMLKLQSAEGEAEKEEKKCNFDFSIFHSRLPAAHENDVKSLAVD